MRDGIFVTGGGGFVGRRLLAGLRTLGRPVIALDRSGTLAAFAAELPGVTVLQGDLLQPESYQASLQSCDVVLHLAAATGRAPAEEHDRVNARGTDVLLSACRQAGVSRILFVSSIAASFPDKTGYHYAVAKTRAEQLVAASGLRFAILRPTIILGPRAPILTALEKLALLPVIVVPGNGRARVQPIHVDDVVTCIVTAVRDDLFANETIEVGGRETVTMDELLQRLRRARTGRAGRVVHIPLGLLRAPLRLAEAIGLGRMLPITAGQLSSFRFDGVAARHGLTDRLRAGFVDLSQMLSAPPTARADQQDALDAECSVFTRYLLGAEPDDYIRAKYRAAHGAVPALTSTDRFGDALIAFARMGPLFTRIADSYAGVFAPAATLRRKLVLLLALLETRPPFHLAIDKTIDGPAPLLLARLAVSTIGALLTLIAGTIVFVPTRVVVAVIGKGPR